LGYQEKFWKLIKILGIILSKQSTSKRIEKSGEFDYEDILKRGKTNLDIFWLKVAEGDLGLRLWV